MSRAFVELAPTLLPDSGECVVEFEDGSGAHMRVHLRGCDVPDLVALVPSGGALKPAGEILISQPNAGSRDSVLS